MRLERTAMEFGVVDVSAITGSLVTSRMTAWSVLDGSELVEHLAGRAPNGDLLVFYWTPSHDWKVVNVSQKTGERVAGQVASWVVPNGNENVEHLAGRSPTGDLLVFYWSPSHDWQVVNVSAKTGQKISDAVTSWTTPDGNLLVEHLAGRGINGD